MSSHPCPKCHSLGNHLPATSENALVDYYRCNHCGHVWSLDKQGARRDVTIDEPLRRPAGLIRQPNQSAPQDLT